MNGTEQEFTDVSQSWGLSLYIVEMGVGRTLPGLQEDRGSPLVGKVS